MLRAGRPPVPLNAKRVGPLSLIFQCRMLDRQVGEGLEVKGLLCHDPSSYTFTAPRSMGLHQPARNLIMNPRQVYCV